MALEQPQRVGRVVLMGPGGIGMSQGKPTDGLKRLLGYYGGEGPTLEKLRAVHLRGPGLRRQPRYRVGAARALRVQHRSGGDRQPAAARAEGSRSLQASGLPARSAPAEAREPDARAVGHRGPRQPERRRAGIAGQAAGLRRVPLQPHRPLGAVGACATSSTPSSPLSLRAHA